MKSLLIGLIFLILFPIIFVFAQSDDDLQSLFKTAKQHQLNNEFNNAELIYDKILEIEPENIDALTGKGIVLIQMKKPAESLSFFDKIIELQPNNYKALNNKGSAFFLTGDNKEALNYFSKSLDLNLNYKPARDNFEKVAADFHGNKLEGYAELILRDSHGNLIAYQKASDLAIIDHEIFKKRLDLWPVVNDENQVNSSLMFTPIPRVFDSDYSYTNFGITYKDTKIFYVSFHHSGFPVNVGDELSITYTIIKPSN